MVAKRPRDSVTVAPSRVRLPVLGAPSPAIPARPSWFDREPSHLVDGHGREVTYARLSIIDRCDLACVYCRPAGTSHVRRADLLTFEEIARIAALLSRVGVRRLRLTGGEPLLRRRVVDLVRAVRASAPELACALSSNGTQLTALAAPLAAAGLQSVNVSLDTLDAGRFQALTSTHDLSRVIAGIDAAVAAGLDVKLNAVVLGRESVDEAEALLRFAVARGAPLRFIELMPLGVAAGLPPESFVPVADVEAALAPWLESGEAQVVFGLVGFVRYRRVRDTALRVGFIAAVSRTFCAGCNRIRLTARGELQPCLGSPARTDLGRAMRKGGSDLDLAWQLVAALATKSEGHEFLDPLATAHQAVVMTHVGG